MIHNQCLLSLRRIQQSQNSHDQLPALDDRFTSLQQRALRGELDLSRLVLDLLNNTPDSIAPANNIQAKQTQSSGPHSPNNNVLVTLEAIPSPHERKRNEL